MNRNWNVLACGLTLLIAGCGEEQQRQPEVRAVRTMVVAPRPVEDDRRAIGEVKARYESDIGFRVSGKVVARLVDVGASVKKGDVLARLDTQDYQNKLKSAESDIVAAQAALVEAQGAEARLRHLLANGHTTRANYDVALKNLRSAEAKDDAARHRHGDGARPARLRRAAGRFRRHRHGGRRRGRPDRQRRADGGAPGAAGREGRRVRHRRSPRSTSATGSAPPEIVVALLSNPAIQAEGVVREISPVADPATRTFQVKVTLKNPPEQMRFGASVVRPREGLERAGRGAAGGGAVRQGRAARRVDRRPGQASPCRSRRWRSIATRPTA